MKAGLIGCGVIGTELAKFIDNNKDIELIGITDTDETKIDNLKGILKNNQPETLDTNSLIEKSELIIEAASGEVAKELLNKVADKDKKAMFMSTGGLIDSSELLKNSKAKIYLPSGAIAGIDGIKSASVGKIKSITLTTTKHPEGLKDAPYVVENNINLSEMTKKTIIFKGSVDEAVKGFPKNINVAATLSLASNFKMSEIAKKAISEHAQEPKVLDKLKIKIIADPKIKTNTHEIKVVGESGKIKTKTENIPSPSNPKTSYLAVLSGIATLKQITEKVRVGT